MSPDKFEWQEEKIPYVPPAKCKEQAILYEDEGMILLITHLKHRGWLMMASYLNLMENGLTRWEKPKQPLDRPGWIWGYPLWRGLYESRKLPRFLYPSKFEKLWVWLLNLQIAVFDRFTPAN